MACRSVHFALSSEQTQEFKAIRENGDDAIMAFVQDIEEQWDQDWLQECDKAWDAIHRCLTDGNLEYGESPLHKCILGKGSVHEGDEYIVSFLEPPDVKEVAAAIKSIDQLWLRKKCPFPHSGRILGRVLTELRSDPASVYAPIIR